MTIEQIANSSEISKQVFKALSDKQRARRATDLTNLYREMSRKDKTLQEKEMIQVFKKLEDAGIGSLVIGRRSNHNRFVWSYNLKHVALAAKGKIKQEAMESVETTGKKKTRGIRKVSTKASPVTVVKPTILRKAIKERAKKLDVPAPEVMKVEEKVVSKGSSTQGPILQFQVELSANTRPQDIQAILELIKDLHKK